MQPLTRGNPFISAISRATGFTLLCGLKRALAVLEGDATGVGETRF